jgi:tetratricopeptide (TPR) repeat protein
LKGQLYFHKGDWSQSLKNLLSVQKNAKSQKEAQLWIARNYFQMKDFDQCVSSYKSIAFNQHALESDFLAKAECEFKKKKYEEAWKTLWIARERYLSFAVERELIALQVAMGMSREALVRSLNWLSQGEHLATHFLNLSEIFQAKASTREALILLELGRVRHPLQVDLNLSLAQVHFQKGLLLAAEEAFSRAALSDGKYYYHTAELNRQTGRFERSLYFNGFIIDEKERLKQKIATYVDANRYSLIASMDSVIQRSELQKDDEIRYALAYSLVRVGIVEKPLYYLSQITKPELIEKTTVLRQALLDCQAKKGACRL